jgi:hypothetical protein
VYDSVGGFFWFWFWFWFCFVFFFLFRLSYELHTPTMADDHHNAPPPPNLCESYLAAKELLPQCLCQLLDEIQAWPQHVVAQVIVNEDGSDFSFAPDSAEAIGGVITREEYLDLLDYMEQWLREKIDAYDANTKKVLLFCIARLASGPKITKEWEKRVALMCM